MTNSHEMQVIGFLDDDDRLHGYVLNGQPTYNPGDLANFVPTLNISDVLLAMSSIGRKRRNEILSEIRNAHVSVLGSVQNDDRMRKIMSIWHPDTVYHAAAHKHVPLVAPTSWHQQASG